MPAGPALATTVRRELGWARTRVRRRVARTLVSARRRSLGSQAPRAGVTVVAANWNSQRFAQVLVRAVSAFPAHVTELLFVDNASDDGSPEWLAKQPGVRVVKMPMNVGHGAALDIGMIEATTETVVALDVDAFPIASDWIDVVLDPLESGATVAGAHFHRGYIHPCFLAMRRKDFLDLGVSFMPVGRWTRAGRYPATLFMDVGEALSHVVALDRGSSALHKVPLTDVCGPGMAGSVFGDVVYHNFYSTQGDPELVRKANELWDESVAHYLPPAVSEHGDRAR